METEYLIFFPDQGKFTVDVKFEQSNTTISKRHAEPEHVARLLDFLGGAEQPEMTFDDYPGKITKIMIDPAAHKIQLSVRLSETATV